MLVDRPSWQTCIVPLPQQLEVLLTAKNLSYTRPSTNRLQCESWKHIGNFSVINFTSTTYVAATLC
mgnify:CR=1 FL=1